MNKKLSKPLSANDYPKMAKFEAYIMQFENKLQATLIAQRLHNHFNVEFKSVYGKFKYSFVTSSGYGHSRLFMGSTQPVDDMTRSVIMALAATYKGILDPFFA